MSLALVGCEGSVRFGGIPEQANSGARLRESRSVPAAPSPVQIVEQGRPDTLLRPAIRAAPSLSTKMFSYGMGRGLIVMCEFVDTGRTYRLEVSVDDA